MICILNPRRWYCALWNLSIGKGVVKARKKNVDIKCGTHTSISYDLRQRSENNIFQTYV